MPPTHEVLNQPPPLAGYDLYSSDPVLGDTLVDLFLLDRRKQQTDCTEPLALLRAHRAFHVFGNAVFE